MTRRRRARVLLTLVALLATGCQEYNFNPVRNCLIAPARERIPLSDISTADVLFVIDDSGSMKFEQEELGQNFAAFIANLNVTNADRVASGLAPIDFHVAVTTSSVFFNSEIPSKTVQCRGDCPGASGNVCCEMTSSAGGLTPARPWLGSSGAPAACQAVGADCGAMQTSFRFDGSCVHGNAVDGAPYPQGAFVGFGENPRVLHFDKELYPAPGTTRDPALPACPVGATACNRQGFTAAELEGWFASQVNGTWQGNVIAGTCGSGQEQGLQAAKLALDKALAGQQLDTRDARGAPASVPAEWPHENSKLVLVFVGDEDDCSSELDPAFGPDPSRGVIMTASGSPGADACTRDADAASPRRKQIEDFVDHFTTRGRPVAAAFIVSTKTSTCVDASCEAGQCCGILASGPTGDNPNAYACFDTSTAPPTPVCRTSTCGGQAGGFRLLEAATGLVDEQVEPRVEVVRGSVCDPAFDTILGRVAEIVKPPPGLALPTRPAADEVTMLRIARPDGTTRKTCRGPAPAEMTEAEALAAGYVWWFTTGRTQTDPVARSQYVYINHGDTGDCEANPGETYSADYVSELPAGGCQTREDCYAAMGGTRTPRAWTCYAGGSLETGWIPPTPEVPGSCVCGDLSPDLAGQPGDSY